MRIADLPRCTPARPVRHRDEPKVLRLCSWRLRSNAGASRLSIGLNRKAQTTTDPTRKKAYQAAARDTLESVKMLALIRAERVPEHLVDALGRFFMDRALPVLIKLLPAIIAAL